MEDEINEVDEALAETEARARAMGWHPLEDFKGDPERWTDAAAFIARGEEHLPILRDQNRRLADKVSRLEGEVSNLTKNSTEQLEAIRDLTSLAKRSNEQGYQRALAEEKAKRREAVQNGDQEAFDQSEERIARMTEARAETERPPTPRETPPAKPAAAVDPAVQDFVDENPWFNTNQFLNTQMIAAHGKVMRRAPAMALADQLAEALDDLKEQFPEEFGVRRTETRPRAAAVSAPSRHTPGRTAKSGFDLIDDPNERAEAKAAFERIKRQQPDMTEKDYLAIYLDPHADVLALKRTA